MPSASNFRETVHFATKGKIKAMQNTRFDYCQSLREVHPDLYWNTQSQKAMQHEAKLLGNVFYTMNEFEFMDLNYDQRYIR